MTGAILIRLSDFNKQTNRFIIYRILKWFLFFGSCINFNLTSQMTRKMSTKIRLRVYRSAIMKINRQGGPEKETEWSIDWEAHIDSFKKMANPDIAQVSSLPLPPMQYINLYTDENIKMKRVPRPPPPIHDSYNMFGHTFNADDTIIRSLESQGIKRLYPQHFDRRKELRKLNHSLLVNFLDLLDTLVLCPDSPKRTEKVDDLSLLFFHIHHLLNEFRPHQARETLRVMMELQKRQRNETAVRFQKHLDKVLEIINTAIHSLPDTSDNDCKLLINTELSENMDLCNGDSAEKDIYTELDKQMCDIVDAL